MWRSNRGYLHSRMLKKSLGPSVMLFFNLISNQLGKYTFMINSANLESILEGFEVSAYRRKIRHAK